MRFPIPVVTAPSTSRYMYGNRPSSDSVHFWNADRAEGYMLAVYAEDDGNGNIYHPSVSDANGSDPRIIERTEFTKRSLTDIEERSDIGFNNCVYIRVRFNTRQDLETL